MSGVERIRVSVLFLVASAALAFASFLALHLGGGSASATSPPPLPRIVDVRYFENLEDGRRYNVRVIAKRHPVGIAGKVNGVRAEAEFVRGKARRQVAFFRSKRFVKAFRADIADGLATIKVWAANEGGAIRKRCAMKLETDPRFGDSAVGDCRRF